MRKVALIFDTIDQEGFYLSKFLLKKKYRVVSIVKKIKQKKYSKNIKNKNFIELKNFNFYNKKKIEELIRKTKCNEIYFFFSKSTPAKFYNNLYEIIVSNLIPVYYILETLKKLKKKIKLFNSFPENIIENKKKLKSSLNSYELAKQISLNLTKFYREKNNLNCHSYIFSNDESGLSKRNYKISKAFNENSPKELFQIKI
tara:strand:- start:281 stop:880 length:600 start_codon:yes stop_codon:yes gene_type:complete